MIKRMPGLICRLGEQLDKHYFIFELYRPFLVGLGCIFAFPPLVALLTGAVWMSSGIASFGTAGRTASTNLRIGLAVSIAKLSWNA